MDISPDRHPGTKHFQPMFRYDHLPEHLQEISKPFHDLAQFCVDKLADGPELSATLRKLWEAKNSAVVQHGFIRES